MKRTTIAFICIALFVILGIAVSLHASFIINFDTKIASLMKEVQNPFHTSLFKILTTLGSAGVVGICGVLVALFLFLKKRIRESFAIIIIPGITFVLVEIVKYTVARARPLGGLIPESGPGFPSGHATITAVFLTCLFFIFISQNPSQKRKLLWGGLFAIIAILIALSRVYLGVHFASDVIAGLLLGLGIGLSAKKYLKNDPIQNRS